MIAILGVMLGTVALIVTLSILDGFEQQIKEKAVDFTSHIQVQAFQNLPLGKVGQSIEKVRDSIPEVRSISPFASREGMVRSRSGVDGIFIKGVNLSTDQLMSRHHLVEGRYLDKDSADAAQLIIGKRLANKLEIELGDKLAVFAFSGNQPSGQPRVKQFRVVGIFESGMAEYDEVFAYAPIATVQELLQLGRQVTGYDILVNDIRHVDDVARRLDEVLGYPHYARTVFQVYRNLFSWVELQKKLSPILLSLIIVVATVNIIGTLLMFVLEKTRAIGILKSLGAGPRLIRRIFILQGVTIAGTGILLGNALAFVLCWIQLMFQVIAIPSEIYYMTTVPIALNPWNFLVVTVVAFILCLTTTLIPSRAAAKLDPVTALRFG